MYGYSFMGQVGFGRSLVLPLFQLIEVKAANKLFYNGNHGVFLQMCQFSPGLFGPLAPPYYQTDVSIGYIQNILKILVNCFDSFYTFKLKNKNQSFIETSHIPFRSCISEMVEIM